MRSLRSVLAGGTDRASDVAKEAYTALSSLYPAKLLWCIERGYTPHEWQAAFHAANHNGRLCRFRHLVAGRRGGKTLSAAWEVLYYCTHPEEFHRDAHSVDSTETLWVWVLTKDHEVGRPARMAMQKALNQAGLVKDKDYKWNRTEKTIEFYDSVGDVIAFLQFKTADDPQSLRGAGLDILWIDESAFVPARDAWDVVRPALSDKIGLVVTTTTPCGKNWFWEEFFSGKALIDPRQFRVEYTSIDRPSFHKEEWVYAKDTMHPALFAQEYMASFDAMAGLTLSGDWLHYFTDGTPDDLRGIISTLDRDNRPLQLRKFIGVDTSTGEGEDDFAIACIGVTLDNTQAFLLDYWTGHLEFPDQIDMIRRWHQTHKPQQIGIEANAFQRVLVQMANRLAGFPPVTGVYAVRDKTSRFVSMAPLFKIGKIRIMRQHKEFIDQWVSYNAKQKLNRDDLLDAVEIALGCAGVILPSLDSMDRKGPRTEQEEAQAQIAALRRYQNNPYDPELGSEV